MSALVQRIDSPIYVVTAADTFGLSGCLVSFATPTSVVPPRLLVCLPVASTTYATARRAQALAVHLLGADQADLTRSFDPSGDGGEAAFKEFLWRPGVTGAPVLESCAAWVEGDVLERVQMGDHVGFMVAPVDGGAGGHSGQLSLRYAPQEARAWWGLDPLAPSVSAPGSEDLVD